MLSSSELNIIFFLNIVLDWERLGPLWKASQDRDDLNIKLIATEKFFNRHNDIVDNHGEMLSNKTLLKLNLVNRPDAIVTATESSASPHRITNKITKYANFMRIPTITIQHGYECVGISYADEVYDESISIASKNILIWQDTNNLPETFRNKIGRRCITTGFIASDINKSEVDGLSKQLKDLSGKLSNKIKKWILVTENLHWNRYDDEYKDTFHVGLKMAVENNPDIGFIVKPHPAGLFLAKIDVERFPVNLFLSTSICGNARSEPGIEIWLTCVDGLITSPSTTAIDAAVINKPVLVVKNNLSGYWPYEPLYSIKQKSDWLEGIKTIRKDPEKLAERSNFFLEEQAIKISSAESVLDKITSILA